MQFTKYNYSEDEIKEKQNNFFCLYYNESEKYLIVIKITIKVYKLTISIHLKYYPISRNI